MHRKHCEDAAALADQDGLPSDLSSDDDPYEAPGPGLLGIAATGAVHEPEDAESAEGDGEDNADGAHSDVPSDAEGSQRCGALRGSEVTRRRIESAVEAEVCDLLMFLEITKGVPGATVDRIVESLYEVATYGQQADPCGNPLRSVMTRISVRTAKQRRSQYQGQFGQPCGRVLTIPGMRNEKSTMYLKTVSQHLNELVKSEDIVHAIMGTLPQVYKPWYQRHDEFYHDFASADRFDAVSGYLGGEPFIPLRIYGDGFSQNNIGPHRLDRSEIYGIYMQPMCYPPHLSRNINSWNTVLLADTSAVNDCRRVWARVIQDLEVLQEKGIYVPSLDRTVRVILISYVGDLKDQQLVCGMAASGARYPHATNLVTSDDTKNCTSFEDIDPRARPRNRPDHNRDIEVFRQTKSMILSRGAKWGSVFDPVADFIEHPAFLTVDTSHTFFLGTVKSDVGLALSVFVSAGVIAENELEGAMSTFKVLLTGEERSNFIVNLFSARVGDRVPVKGSISQCRLLTKYCTVIFANIAEAAVAEGGRVLRAWRLLVELHRTFLYMESFALANKQLDEFQGQLERYINQRIRVRDDFEAMTKDRVDLIPKHVDLLSSVANYRAIGSLVLSSTTTMESRNGHHKEAIRKTRNRINVIKSAAIRTELWEKSNQSLILSREEIVPSSFGLPSSREHISKEQRDEIRRICGADFSQNVTVHGRMLRSGSVIDVYEDDTCTETRMVKMLGVDCSDPDGIRFLVENFEHEYLELFDLYGAKNLAGDVDIVAGEALCVPASYVPLRIMSERFCFVFTKSMVVPVK